ncbi:nucleotide-binding universal stress UspA family protein [Nonomuraea thailandensis]|uniref:Nucleotide-binding universal stress UspA family protein n=1 Tax=Nonomuraea thailandensis TaxID=1188745 RepID=A0A9X2GCS1_9ACTN|nr:nucleotide-binding universal stress UspA family protein [Nonomuraea thailandensis]
MKLAGPPRRIAHVSDPSRYVAGLLAVGSYGRGALGTALLGPVSRGVLHHARCPVAAVRA